MNIRLFPRLFVVCAALFFSGSAIGQSSEADPRSVNTALGVDGSTRLVTEPAVSPAAVEESRPRTVGLAPTPKSAAVIPAPRLNNRFDQLLLTAIQSHLGASYHFNRTGPEEFDCSGLVWRAFQDIGVEFQRGPARSYWATFEAPPASEQFKFGNLVFFSNLAHVGIVVDEKGFYHSARHGGVMYSPFNEYWLSRIDGFRRVPIDSLGTSTATAQPRAGKPLPTTQAIVEEDNEP